MQKTVSESQENSPWKIKQFMRCRLRAAFCLMFAWLESVFCVTSSLKDVMCHVWRSHVDSTWPTDWSSNNLVCLWRGWRMVRGGQWASRERRMRTRRISRATIPSVLWWRTATCCTTSLARPASSLKRAFHRHSYVTQHKPPAPLFFHSSWFIFIPTSWLTSPHPSLLSTTTAVSSHPTRVRRSTLLAHAQRGRSISSMEIIDRPFWSLL